VLIRKKEIEKLSADIRKIIDGEKIDLRDNRANAFSILKNDIHTLANLKNEQVDALGRDRDTLKETLADISHQLKTPITSMMIMADLLEDAPPEKQAEFLKNIKTGLARMEWLVSTLLKMAKLEAGVVDFSCDFVKSTEIVELALETLKIPLDVKNQRITVSNDSEIYCDRRWTAEALTNILKNASEYSPDNSEIRIESGNNPICAWISVTDSGPGISKNEITKLFKRFEGSSSDKDYGIGLPIALAIMRGQNGDIEVDSGGHNLGATITLKFFK
jgi:signal transduction histidine kinase